jgi:hypothetical protein
MEQFGVASIPAGTRVTLRASGIRALSVQGVLLVAASVVLPAAAHLAGLPVRLLLPMHWPVILVGLVYGWRSGAIVGLAVPGLSYLVSGMPYPAILPAMTIELAAYGLLAGALREQLRWNPFLATALAIVAGRVVFLLVAGATGAIGSSGLEYVRAALVPGLATALAQVLVLPLLAGWWVRRNPTV